MPDTNGTQSEARNRPYVVLEQKPLADLIAAVLAEANVDLAADQASLVADATEGRLVWEEKARLPSRNAAHALSQVGRSYAVGETPPLVAVSERMFVPRQLNIEAGDPRISLL